MKTTTALFAVISVGAVAWYAGRNADPATPAEPPAPVARAAALPIAPAPAEATPLGASAVLAIDPKSLARARAPARTSPPTLLNEFFKAKSLRALYDRLRNSPEGETAEGKLVLYEILQQCATVSDAPRMGAMRATAAKRDDFVAGIPANDPQRDHRIAAFDTAVERCAGFSDVSVTRADMSKLLAESAAAGDARAQALAMEQQLWQSRRTAGGAGVTLTDPQVDQLRQLAGSHDPEAIRIAGRILAGNWSDYALRVGTDPSPVESRALANAFALVACEYGGVCDANNPRILQACAYQGHCDAQTLADYLYFYGSTPHDSQLLANYQAIVRTAMQTGDWSQLAVVRGLPAPPRPFVVPGQR